MFRALLATVLLLVVGTAQAQGLASRQLSTSTVRNVLYIAQDVSVTGDTTVHSQIAPLTTSSMGFGIDKNAVKLASPPVSVLPRVGVANPTTQVMALDAAQLWMKSQVPSFQSRLGTYVKSQGLSSAFYTFTQDIMVSTPAGQKRRAIGFNVTVDQNGRAIYGSPKIIDTDPTILEAMYVPAAAIDGLPANWTYPGAGSIQYRLLNKKYEPITGYTTIATGGAFDEQPDSADPDAKLKCLMDRRYAGCSGPTDIRALADEMGASMAIVDYVRRIEPDYEELADGTQQARGAISYDARLWDCGSYINKGFFGYVLRLRADRYSANISGALTPYQLLQQFGGKTISPSEPFSKSVSVSSLTANGLHPKDVLISPNPGENTLWMINDADRMKNVIYVAPVRSSGGDGIISGASFAGDMAVREVSVSGNTREYYIGTIGDDYWGSGQYDRTVTFNLENPMSLDEFALTEVNYDDWFMINVNGTTLYIGPKGGDMLQMTYGSNSFETGCYPSGSGWTCSRSYTSTIDKEGKPVSPGSSCSLTAKTETTSTWSCPVTYGYCNSSSGGHLCRNTPCEPGMVQYYSNAYGSWGCSWPELAKQHRYYPYTDLRPYLRSGQNSIFMRTIVAGGGEGWFKLRSKACGTNMNLELGAPPPVPADAGKGGVLDEIEDKANW